MAADREPETDENPEPVPLNKRFPAHRVADVEHFASTSAPLVEAVKINEIAGLLWLPTGLSAADRDARIVKAIDLFDSIKPADGVEAMLATQMVGTHHAAMECLRRAMVEGQTFEGRNQSLTHAQRLMALYAQQIAALDKYRGKGQQKITVERVQVAAGGQAIVGNVQAAPNAVPEPAGAQAALSPPVDDTVPLPVRRAKSKVPR